MIKNSIIFIFIVGLISISCRREKVEPELNIPPELIGKWKIVQNYITDGGPHYWANGDTGCDWDFWLINSGKFIKCYPNSMNCEPHIGSFSVIDSKIIVDWRKQSCSTDTQSILTIDKLSRDTLIYDWNFWEGGKTMLVKVSNSISDTCNCK